MRPKTKTHYFLIVLLLMAPFLIQCQSSSNDGGGLSSLGSTGEGGDGTDTNDEPDPTTPVNADVSEDELPASCEEEYKNNGAIKNGYYYYLKLPDREDPISLPCALVDGVVWTGITPDAAKNYFQGKIEAEIGEKKDDKGPDKYWTSDDQPVCRKKKKNGDNNSTCHYTITLPFEIQEFYLEDYVIKAAGPKKNKLKIVRAHRQLTWDQAWSGYDSTETPSSGDVSFGDPTGGVAVSFGEEAKKETILVKTKKEYKWPKNRTIYQLKSRGNQFRIGWGNSNSSESNKGWWYPWWSGVIYVR